MASLIRRKDPGQAWETEVDTGGGGGSQPVRVIGPVPIEYADFHTDGQTLDLFDTTAGDVLLDAWYDPATAVNWDDSGISALCINETPPGPAVHVNQSWGFLPLENIAPSGSPVTKMPMIVSDSTLSTDCYIAGQQTTVPQVVFAGGVLTAYNKDGANDGAVGHIDLYFPGRHTDRSGADAVIHLPRIVTLAPR